MQAFISISEDEVVQAAIEVHRVDGDPMPVKPGDCGDASGRQKNDNLFHVIIEYAVEPDLQGRLQLLNIQEEILSRWESGTPLGRAHPRQDRPVLFTDHYPLGTDTGDDKRGIGSKLYLEVDTRLPGSQQDHKEHTCTYDCC